MKKRTILIITFCAFVIFSCRPQSNQLVVMTHDSFSVSETIIADFEEMNGVDVVFLPSGDAGSTLNRAILSKEAPIADVLYGVDNTFLSRAIDAEIFIPLDFQMYPQFSSAIPLLLQEMAVPVDYGDVCINYDKSFFKDNALDLPQSLGDLLDPVYKTLLVVENPATSSPGLAFLLATIAEYSEEGYLDYWRALLENGTVVVNDWETAYYTNFSGSAGQGPQPMVVSYGTSPAAEVIFAETALDEAPTGSLVGDNMCFRQVEYAGVLKGTKNEALAISFVKYMLSNEFQSDIPLNMFVYPAVEDVEIPQAFIDFAHMPDKPAVLDPDLIAENREAWIEAWRGLITR